MTMTSAMARAVLIKTANSRQKCEFCQLGLDTGSKDLTQGGHFYKFKDKFYHFFCLLFSKNAFQSYEEDDQGLNGFAAKDIAKALKESQSMVCQYCGQARASVQCFRAKCKVTFHYPCNINHGGVFVFNDKMQSFCSEHVPKEKKLTLTEDQTCLAACLEPTLPDQRCVGCVQCNRRFHSACLQKLALRSGQAHYKCPACSDQDLFKKESIRMGIYLPVKDADWELDEEFYGFQAMGQLYRHCDAPRCLCPKGRGHDVAGGDYEIIRCEDCGSKAVHIKCGRLKRTAPRYQDCPDCHVMEEDDEDDNEGHEEKEAEEEEDAQSVSSLSTFSLTSSKEASPRPRNETDNDDDAVSIIVLSSSPSHESFDDDDRDEELNIIQDSGDEDVGEASNVKLLEELRRELGFEAAAQKRKDCDSSQTLNKKQHIDVITLSSDDEC